MTYSYRLLPGGYVDETGVHRGVPPTQEDFARIALLCAHRTMFSQEKIKYKIIDPYSPDPILNTIVIQEEMPIEEAKKRWPENFEKENDESE